MDEDCLYLNIYTPTVDSGQAQKFPVMFYIHDGKFEHGSGNDFQGHQLAANGQVVVVTTNYRLGALREQGTYPCQMVTLLYVDTMLVCTT